MNKGNEVAPHEQFHKLRLEQEGTKIHKTTLADYGLKDLTVYNTVKDVDPHLSTFQSFNQMLNELKPKEPQF